MTADKAYSTSLTLLTSAAKEGHFCSDSTYEADSVTIDSKILHKITSRRWDLQLNMVCTT
jgi:hypothetical protein